MKKHAIIFTFICFIASTAAFSQVNGTKEKSNDETYRRKTTKTKTETIGSKAEIDSIRKETAPILNDNGSTNTTGAVEGGRSSTGRPGADTTVSYTVRKRKKIVQTGGVIMQDSTKKKK